MATHPIHPIRRFVTPLRVLGWSFAAGLLLLPLIAMQFTAEVNWDGADFVFAAILIGGVGLALELAVWISPSRAYHAAAALALLAGFLLIWINAAVGILGSENNPLNLIYAGVLLVAVVGALVAGFEPRAMARAMTVTATAQAGVAVIAWTFGYSTPVLTLFFMGLWMLSAGLFRKAGREAARR